MWKIMQAQGENLNRLVQKSYILGCKEKWQNLQKIILFWTLNLYDAYFWFCSKYTFDYPCFPHLKITTIFALALRAAILPAKFRPSPSVHKFTYTILHQPSGPQNFAPALRPQNYLQNFAPALWATKLNTKFCPVPSGHKITYTILPWSKKNLTWPLGPQHFAADILAIECALKCCCGPKGRGEIFDL